jgi:CxxC motif-containing protein (DUF1111 family)
MHELNFSGRSRCVRRLRNSTVTILFSISSVLVAGLASAQSDPGVRGGPAGAGGIVAGTSVQETKYFNTGLARFQETDSVSGTVSGTESGLGPTFNMDSCSGCHLQPAVGGSSPAVNPQVAVANKNGATNVVPFFITTNGPVREARFKSDGGVHDLYTITGRTDAPGCIVAQPDFAGAFAAGNLIFRIPTPTFGSGLMEMITDATILANQSANAGTKAALGITGHPNRSGNDGTITRFGWKAQNKSLQIFAAEAYNVEMGVTNEGFQTERDQTPGCQFNVAPEDKTNISLTQPEKISSDVVMFSHFMRFLAPPAPACTVGVNCSTSVNNGSALFSSTGCTFCHTRSLPTGPSTFGGLGNQTANLFSDLLVHHMGSNLSDGIAQGGAGPDEFRTAPLWGVGQRIFFLHDGRTSDLLAAINAHSSSGSEANAVIANFAALSASQQQDVINFLRSL